MWQKNQIGALRNIHEERLLDRRLRRNLSVPTVFQSLERCGWRDLQFHLRLQTRGFGCYCWYSSLLPSLCDACQSGYSFGVERHTREYVGPTSGSKLFPVNDFFHFFVSCSPPRWRPAPRPLPAGSIARPSPGRSVPRQPPRRGNRLHNLRYTYDWFFMHMRDH